MGYRDVDQNADYSTAGEGWYGIDRYLQTQNLEFLHLFGTVHPDNRMRDLWDYSLNDRPAANFGMTLRPRAATGGYYRTGAAASDLGPALTLFGLLNRFGATGDCALVSNIGGTGFPLAIGYLASGSYIARIGDPNEGIAPQISIPFDSYAAGNNEMMVLVVPGDGTAKLHVLRPPGYASLSGTASGLSAGRVYSGARLLAGKSYSGTFANPSTGLTAGCGGYSRAMSDADVLALQAGLRKMAGDYGGHVW